MNSDRRRPLLLSVLASLVFWLGVEWMSRLPLSDPDGGFLAPIPGWKRLLLVAVVAGALSAMAWLIALVTARRWARRALWVVALVVMVVGTRVWFDAIAEAYSPYDDERPHMPLRFDQPSLAGTVWWNITGGDCGLSVSREVLVFESDMSVRREIRHVSANGYSTVVYALLGVWPDGEYTDTGHLRDGVIHWRDEYSSPQRIERVPDGLRLMWVPDPMTSR